MKIQPQVRWRRRTAWVLALAADAAQWILIPVFAPGALSPLNDALDVAIGVAMVALLGWHWAFLPAFALELIPFADLAPTWTIAVGLATRGASKEAASSAVVDAKPVLSPEFQPKGLTGVQRGLRKLKRLLP
jgi:hypothetical protein